MARSAVNETIYESSAGAPERRRSLRRRGVDGWRQGPPFVSVRPWQRSSRREIPEGAAVDGDSSRRDAHHGNETQRWRFCIPSGAFVGGRDEQTSQSKAWLVRCRCDTCGTLASTSTPVRANGWTTRRLAVIGSGRAEVRDSNLFSVSSERY